MAGLSRTASAPNVKAANKAEKAKATDTAPSSSASEASTAASKKTETSAAGRNVRTAGVFIVLVLVGYMAFNVLSDKKKVQAHLEAAIEWIQAQGDNALYAYLGLTFLGVVCLLPTTPMEFAGGFLFSPVYGMWTTLFLTSFAKLCANTISVFIARHLVKDWVKRNLVDRSELLTMVSKAVKEEPFKMAFLVRGSMLPLNVKNYGLGVMDIGYLPIACFSSIFTTFYAFQNIYMGAALQDLKDVFSPRAKQAADNGDWASTVKACMPVAFNVALVIFLIKAVKEQIRKEKTSMEEALKEKQGKKKD